MAQADATREPFPAVEQQTDNDAEPVITRIRRTSTVATISSTMKSVGQGFGTSNPPSGFLAGTAEFTSSATAGAMTSNKAALARRATDGTSATMPHSPEVGPGGFSRAPTAQDKDGNNLYEPFSNGYHFPPKYPGKENTVHFLKAFWAYCKTPLGFCVVIYGLNVVAWGGMLFLLLCNASPAMCYPTCNDINSPRRIWIEIDSQILNALFCVTGFGLAPWRFRDWYYLLRWTIMNDERSLRRLAGIHRSWFRLAGSDTLPVNVGPENINEHLAGPGAVSESSIPVPESNTPDAPLTGQRAPPTRMWKLHFVVWTMVWNTFLQCVLSGFMWGMNRYTRPSWSTGLFVALACIVAAMGGLTIFFDGKNVKAIEGVPLTDEDRARLESDRELGLLHYNNLEAKKPKDPKHKGGHEKHGSKSTSGSVAEHQGGDIPEETGAEDAERVA